MPRALRILLVEENDEDVSLILGELERSGFAPTHLQVEDEAGLQSALQEGLWDVVLCCDGVPGLSPYAAFKLVREADPHLPFILHCQHDAEQNAQGMTPRGAHGFVTKQALGPLAPTIERALEQVAERREHPREALKGVRVLLVEDHRELLAVMAEVLELEGCHVAAKASAEEALDYLRDNEPPDVIVCDLSLPGMDGYEFIQRARQLPCMDHVPALALSGMGAVPARFMSPETGFFAYLIKPVPFDKLKEYLLRAYEASRRARQGSMPGNRSGGDDREHGQARAAGQRGG